MNNNNKKYLQRLIQPTGDNQINKLSDHPNHPKERNLYAYFVLKVKNKFGKKYKDFPNGRVYEVMHY